MKILGAGINSTQLGMIKNNLILFLNTSYTDYFDANKELEFALRSKGKDEQAGMGHAVFVPNA